MASQIGAARELVGGEERDEGVWDDVRDRQARALGRLSFPPRGLVQTLAGEDEALVRPAAGTAYVPRPVPEQVEAGARLLAERVRAAFDPGGVLA